MFRFVYTIIENRRLPGSDVAVRAAETTLTQQPTVVAQICLAGQEQQKLYGCHIAVTFDGQSRLLLKRKAAQISGPEVKKEPPVKTGATAIEKSKPDGNDTMDHPQFADDFQ
ncbi:hypothetical protein CWR43_17200 [Rhizobium sullae]|uniref:Uncharacterized protein n=1 Tax=Rhizobium sullae TaxID=50338 RepID=A0A2N0D886_RHISU|nr:hypothetical protein [Rhizobium sullae]PKA42291.1 hypothetical protein CWR43_17200 [Rhizobium sullae]